MPQIVNKTALLVALWMLAFGSIYAYPYGQEHNISGEEYWFFEKLGMLQSVTESGGNIHGLYFAKDSFVPFVVKREAVDHPAAKLQGYKNVLRHWVAMIQNSSDEHVRNEVAEKLHGLAGVQLQPEQWAAWADDNSAYLVWSEKEKHLLVDDEAKAAKTPTLEYRKAHPWPRK